MTQLTVVIHDSGPAQWPVLTAHVFVTMLFFHEQGNCSDKYQ